MNPVAKLKQHSVCEAGLLWAIVVLTATCLFIAAGTASAASSSSIDYTVSSGDTLWLLAQRFTTSAEMIRQENGMTRSTIYAGENLHISFSGRVHIVSRGETLFDIARWYNTTIEEIKWVNNHWSDTIYPGQALAVTDSISGSENQTASSKQPPTETNGLTATDADLLSRLVRAEAQGEPYEGQVAVAAVVLNRVDSTTFPDTITAVIHEPLQFEPVSNGTIYIPADETSRRAVRDAAAGWDPSYGAMYFFNPAKTNNRFLWSRPHVITIGNHRFTN